MTMIAIAPCRGPKPSVLIVDDSRSIRVDLGNTFAAAGFANKQVETLAAGRAALAKESFSLIVLDLILPDGDGLDLLREIKSVPGPATPVLLLSTECEVRDRIKGLKTGADDYVGKPYDRNYIVSRARQLIDQTRPSVPSPSILLVDGNTPFREQFQRVLEEAGYAVTTADSGEEGLNVAFALRPDAIIVDGWLPGINGHIVTQRLKQDVTLRNTPCLLLTASMEPGEEVRVLEEGADAYLRKETGTDVILAKLAALLRTGRKSRPVDASAVSLLGAKRILAVHHSAAFLGQLAVELANEGFSVVPARSGKDALGWLEGHTADCILLDATRAELAARDTCRIVKSHPAWRLIPLLLLTPNVRPQDGIEGFNSGADDCVPSVAGFALLRARIRVQLRRKQFEDQDRAIREQLLAKELQATEARAAQEIAEARAAMVGELEKKNLELEAFAHSVSHDLRSPLRTIRGFTQALLEDYEGQLPAGARDHAVRVMAGAIRMGKLIDDLLQMSQTSRASLRRERFDLSHLAGLVVAELDQERHVECSVEEGIAAHGDPALIRVVLDNLLRNAWKFTGKTDQARIEVGALRRDCGPVFFVRDNGAGFDSAHAPRLFQPFERLHSAAEFPGTGIGLATVRRIVERHGGEIWAESSPGAGASFFFTLPES